MSQGHFQPWALMNLWDRKTWKPYWGKTFVVICLIHLTPSFLWSTKRKICLDPEWGISQWFFRCHYLTICLLEAIIYAQCTIYLPFPLHLYYLPFHEEKKSNKSTGRICGCLIWAFFVSSNNPENWWFLVLAELYGIYYPCPFLQENNGVGKEEKGTLFFQAFFPNKKEKATAKGLCVLLGTESFSLAISKILRRTQKFDFWKSLH